MFYPLWLENIFQQIFVTFNLLPLQNKHCFQWVSANNMFVVLYWIRKKKYYPLGKCHLNGFIRDRCINIKQWRHYNRLFALLRLDNVFYSKLRTYVSHSRKFRRTVRRPNNPEQFCENLLILYHSTVTTYYIQVRIFSI